MGPADSRIIDTGFGTLELLPATVDQLRGIARYWPMELLRDLEEDGGFGLVFQHGDEEVFGIKLQPPDLEEQSARGVHHVNRVLIAAALPSYLERGHRGVMVPCAYYKEKPSGLAESGFAFFVGPDPASQPPSPTPDDVLFDSKLGAGATRMVFDMVAAIAVASREFRRPLLPVIGMEPRPRLAIGGLALQLAVAGPQVLAIESPLQEDQPVWRYVAHAGFSRLPYAPMKPMSFPGQPPPGVPHE